MMLVVTISGKGDKLTNLLEHKYEYLSLHNHGSGKNGMSPIVATFQIQPVSTSMTMRGMGNISFDI